MDRDNEETIVTEEARAQVPALAGLAGTAITADQAKVELDKRVAIVRHLRAAAIASTTPEDWVAMKSPDGSKSYYLEATGAEKVARLYGINTERPEVEQFSDNGYPAFIVSGYIRSSVLGAEVYHVGGRSGNDKFFSKDKTPQQVDILDIRKAACANWRGQGIASLCGLRGVPESDLIAAGLDCSKVGGYEFRDKSGGFDQAAKARAEGKATASGDPRAEITSMLLDMAAGDVAEAQGLLERATAFKGRDGKMVSGKRDINKVSDAAMKPTLGRVREMYEEWKALESQEPPQSGGASDDTLL